MALGKPCVRAGRKGRKKKMGVVTYYGWEFNLPAVFKTQERAYTQKGVTKKEHTTRQMG